MICPFPGSLLRRLLLALIAIRAMSGGASFVRGEEPVGEAVKSAKPAENRFGVHPPMLILKELAVVEGKITKGPLTYTVERAGGQLVIPQRNVMFECADLYDAYKIMKKQIPDGFIKGHVVLARWCLSHRLKEEAQAELRIAEGLDSAGENEEILILNAHLEEMLNPHPPAPPAYPDPEMPEHEVELKGFPAVYVDPLGNLPRHTGLDFTRRVQPILMNSCSTARCHGPEAKRPFTLEIVRSQIRTRNVSEENLSQVLKFVEAGHPETSALLRGHKDSQGNARTPFETPQSKAAEKILEDWILKLEEPDPPEEGKKGAGRPGQANAASSITRGRDRSRQRFLAQKQREQQREADLARKQKLAAQLLDDPDDPKRGKPQEKVMPAPLAVDAD